MIGIGSLVRRFRGLFLGLCLAVGVTLPAGGSPSTGDLPVAAQEMLARGTDQIARRDLTAAVETLQDGIQEFPGVAELHFQLGCALLERASDAPERDPDLLRHAATCFQTALRLDPDHVEARFKLGRAFGDLGLEKDEERVYREVLRRNPDHYKTLFNLSLSLMERPGFNQDSLARGQVEKWLIHAAEVASDQARPLWGLGNLYFSEGRFSDSLKAYSRSLPLQPDSDEGYFGQGICHQALGAFDPALAAFSKALDRNPRLTGGYLKAGAILARQNRRRELRELMDRGLAVLGDQEYFLLEAGTLLVENGHPRPAEDCARRILALRPGSVSATYLLGMVHFYGDGLSRAEILFREVLALDPAYAQAHVGLGFIAQRRKDLALAVREYRWLEGRHPAFAGRLLEKIVGFPAPSPVWNGVLQKAAGNGEWFAVLFLLDCGAPINAVDGLRRTALFWAVVNRRLQVVQLLADHGADLSLADGTTSPVGYAVRRIRSHGDAKGFLGFFQRTVSPEPPATEAEAREYQHIVNDLLKRGAR